jgi:hypothetical protein
MVSPENVKGSMVKQKYYVIVFENKIRNFDEGTWRGLDNLFRKKN